MRAKKSAQLLAAARGGQAAKPAPPGPTQAEVKRAKATNEGMNTFLRSGRAPVGTRSRERGQQPAPSRLVDLFAGVQPKLTAAEQAQCLRLVSGTGKDGQGKAIPAKTAAQAIRVVRPKWRQATGGGEPGTQGMNAVIRRLAGR